MLKDIHTPYLHLMNFRSELHRLVLFASDNRPDIWLINTDDPVFDFGFRVVIVVSLLDVTCIRILNSRQIQNTKNPR